MSSAVTSTTPRLTVEQYLKLERDSQERHEYHDGVVLDMAGEIPAHGDISMNLAILIGTHLKGMPCRARVKDTKVRSGPPPESRNVSKGLFSYPDIVIVCDPIEYHDSFRDVILNPTAIIEVHSPSTETRDRGAKMRSYATWIPSLRDYVLVSQDQPVVERFSRNDAGWLLHWTEGLDAVAEIPSIGCKLPLRDVYDRVEFPLPLDQ